MLFDKDTYDTPEKAKRCIWDKLAFNSRVYFYWIFFLIILKTRKAVKNGVLKDQDYCKTSDMTFNLLEKCGGKIHIKGINNIRKSDGATVFIGNHMSMLETFILPTFIIPIKPVSFIVKESLITHKFFGKVMKGTVPIPVTRKDPIADYKQVMKKGKELLDSGRSIIVFPQKTRGKSFIASEFGSIGEKLAMKANVPVIPIALKTDFWGKGKIFKDFGPINREKHIYIEFGKPVKIDNNSKRIHSDIISFIESRINKWESDEVNIKN